jgi:hypothetical protein
MGPTHQTNGTPFAEGGAELAFLPHENFEQNFEPVVVEDDVEGGRPHPLHRLVAIGFAEDLRRDRGFARIADRRRDFEVLGRGDVLFGKLFCNVCPRFRSFEMKEASPLRATPDLQLADYPAVALARLGLC